MPTPTRVPTTRELEVTLKAQKALQEQIKKQMDGWRAEISRLNEQLSGAERECRNLGDQIAEATNTLFARRALKLDLLAARRAFLEKMKSVQSDEITVAAQKTLQSQVESDLAALQALCTHPFVLSYDGYGGSHSMDHDDAYHGHRVCTLCNLDETSKGMRDDIYAVLADDGTRLVRRDLRKEKELPRSFEQEWFPIVFLRGLFEASAGDSNIRWPESGNIPSELDPRKGKA